MRTVPLCLLFLLISICSSAMAPIRTTICPQNSLIQNQPAQDISVSVLQKMSDPDFVKRNSQAMSVLLPEVQCILSRFFNKYAQDISDISTNLLKKPETYKGVFDLESQINQ